jgi:hypothetical protein
MRLRRFGAKLSLITVGLLLASLAGFAWVYGSIIIDTLAFGVYNQNKLSEVGFGATVVFVFALAKFAVIDCDGEYH